MIKLSIAMLIAIFLSLPKLTAGDIFHPPARYETAISAAQAQEKLLVVYFHSPDSPSCTAMSEICQDKKLAIRKILASSFYPVRITSNLPLSASWYSAFNITTSPTLLFFDRIGTLIHRSEQALASGNLHKLLEDVVFYSQNEQWPMEVAPVELPADSGKTSSPEISPAEGGLALPNRTVISQANTKNKPADNKNSSALNATHRILIRSVVKGVPIAPLINSLRNKFGQVPVSVTSFWQDEEQYYQIWLGRYDKINAAEMMLNQVRKAGYPNAQILQK